MNEDYCVSEECQKSLWDIYKDYFLDDKESFYYTFNEFVKFYDKLPPERLIKVKYRQFLSTLLNKNKHLIKVAADYKSILINLPLYKHLYAIFIEYDVDLMEIIDFEGLFRNFFKFVKFYDGLDGFDDSTPEEIIRVRFVDFMNKLLKFYAMHEKSAYTEGSLPRFEEYLKSKLSIEV